MMDFDNGILPDPGMSCSQVGMFPIGNDDDVLRSEMEAGQTRRDKHRSVEVELSAIDKQQRSIA